MSAENGELVWMNAIKSYWRKESEITKAACRRLSGGNPKKGRLYTMHVRTMIGLAERAPVQAWIVGTIGALEPGDSPDRGGRNPVVEGADMLIGLWDWDRVEGQLRCGWRNREVLAPRVGGTPSKWHLDTRTADGRWGGSESGCVQRYWHEEVKNHAQFSRKAGFFPKRYLPGLRERN